MNRITKLLLIMVLLLTGAFGIWQVQAQDNDAFTYEGNVEAPAFPDDLTWFNVPEALVLDELRGKIVMLDFWTYGCINCVHVIPDLKRLEAEYPEELVVIGVHSAKFDNEGVSENIRQIIQRYGIEHPVVNDADFTIWNRYSARAWPSIYVIDPNGLVVGRHEGEGVYDVLQPVIDVMAQEYGDAGLIDETPIQLTLETDNMTETPLRFPGSVLVDADNDRLFISDSGHNRIVMVSLTDYSVLDIIGNGTQGLIDGNFDSAAFNAPQGMEISGDTLYVADTNNHAIRAVNLITQEVTTIAGTGERAEFIPDGGSATELALRSPWDVSLIGEELYFSMAGTHQIWVLYLATERIDPFAGNAREDLVDGRRLLAELAQPSGLINDGENLYFTDSESSAIRQVELGVDGQVITLVGPVNEPQARLFTFGDVDGGIDTARLQHPLGITQDEDGLLYISDTYNNKIKIIDAEAQTSTTFVGVADGGYFDGTGEEVLFDEPGGLAYHNGTLFVADQNNHAIRVIDVESQSTTTMIFPNVNELLPQDTAGVEPFAGGVDSLDDLFDDEALVLPPQQVRPGEGTILVDAVMPFGYKLNAQAPFTALWATDAVVTVASEQQEYRVVTPELPIEFDATFTEGQTELSVELTIYWCEAINETLCFVERNTVLMPIQVSEGAASAVVSLSYQLVPPETTDGF